VSAILADEGYTVDIAPDGQKALERLANDRYGVCRRPQMPKLDGLALLRELQQRRIATECIVITGRIDSAVRRCNRAHTTTSKSLNADKLNRLKALIPKALEKFEVQEKNRELTSRLEGLTHYGELTGQSEVMRGVYQVIDAVAPSTASVLILGESGTGKELVARALHSKSERSSGPFFALNCAALPREFSRTSCSATRRARSPVL
jgi:DNA-binding NtrC family response regulator